MNRDPLGLGFLLYGFAPAPLSPIAPGVLLAAGGSTLTLIPDGHAGCGISTFCRNPLHPGPCAGWKKKLGIEAPGALNAIEKAHGEKLAVKRAARAEAKSAAAKTLTERHHVSPLHAKKALTKRANMMLGDNETKAAGKADKVILNKAEVKKYSKIKAAQMNDLRTKHGLQEDPGLEERLAEALAADNKDGKDANYKAAIEGSSTSLGAQLAQKHCKKGDGDCDGIPYENLRNELTADAHTALLTGDTTALDKTLADYQGGKLDVSATPHQLAKTKIHDAETASQVLAAAGEALHTHGGKDGLHSAEAQVMKEKLQGVADGNFGAPNSDQKQVAADRLGALFGVEHPGSTKAKNKAKVAEMQAAKDKADAEAKAKAEAAAKKTPAQLAEAMFGADATATPSTPHALNTLHGLSDADVAALDPKTKGKINDFLDGAGKLYTGDTALEIKELKDKFGAPGKPEPKKAAEDAPSLPAVNVPTPADVTPAQGALFDKIASGKVKLIKNDAGFWTSENGAPIKSAPDAMVNALIKKGHLEQKKTGSGGTEVWGVVEPSKNAVAAQKGMEFGLGLMAAAKGKKTLGTKAAQKSFADKIQSHLDGDPNKTKLLTVAAEQIGNTLHAKSGIHVGNQQTEQVIRNLLAEEIEQGLAGKPGPFPLVEAYKKGLEAKTHASIEAVKAEVLDVFKKKAAEKLGVDVNLPAPVVAAKVLFMPGSNYADGKTKQRLDTLKEMTPEHFAQLDGAEKTEIGKWLEDRAEAFDDGNPTPLPELQAAVDFQKKFGLPEHKMVAPPAASKPDLHEMFGPDGSPDHKQVVDAITGMTEADYASLTTAEKGNLADHLADAAGNGEPGAAMSKVKIKSFEESLTQKAKAAGAPSPQAKEAIDYATGGVSGTAKAKLAAYEKLSNEDFKGLPEPMQKAVLADLLKIKDKFVGPKKKEAQDHHDHLAGLVTGGAPAGPSAGPAAPASDAEKLASGSNTLTEMIHAIGDAPDPNKAAAAGSAILSKAQANGSYDSLAKSMASFQSDIGMKKLGKMHDLNPDAAQQVQAALEADIEKKMHATGAATPVYDAWLKAMGDGSPANLKALEKAAGSGPLVAKPAAATDGEKTSVKANAFMAINDAWFGKPEAGAVSAGKLDSEVKAALSDGVGSSKHQAWAKSTADDASKITLDSAFEGIGWISGEDNAIPPAVKTMAEAVIAHDVEQALLSTGPYSGGKPAEYLKKAVAEINAASSDLAAKQGWPIDAPAIKQYEQAIMQAKLENLPKLFPIPVGDAKPGHVGPTIGGPIPVGHGAATSFSNEQQQILTGTIKANNVNLSSAAEHDWDTLVAAASAHAGKDGLPDTLSVMDVLNAVDAGHAKNLGVANTGKLREKIVAWLKTPAGKKYAEGNAAPKAKMVGAMTGELTPKLPPGVKIQPVGGPGGYKADYKPTLPKSGALNTDGWHMQTWQEALANREAYWAANPGTKWTPEAKEALRSYTMGSSTMNNWLRGETPDGTPVHTASQSTKQAVLDAQSAMVPSQQDMFLRRGTGWEQFPPAWRSPEALKAQIGQNFSDKAFLSTSVTGGGSHGFGNKPVGLEIEAPKGTHGIMVEDISHFKGGSEQEMILAAGTVMRILSVKEVNGRTIVRVRVVTPK